MSEIKQGYKQTKVGTIPEDWEVVKLGTVLRENVLQIQRRNNSYQVLIEFF